MPLIILSLSSIYCPGSNKKGGIVSLVPSATEILISLGLSKSITGITSVDGSIDSTEIVGDMLSVSFERIYSLKPDYVILTLPLQKNIYTELKNHNIKILTIKDPKNIEELFEIIDTIGSTFSRKKRALYVIDSLRKEIEQLHVDTLIDVYVEISRNPFYTIGKNTFIAQGLSIIGLKNIFDDVETGYFPVSIEKIYKKSPEIILLLYPNADVNEVKKRIGWNRIKAIKSNKVFTIKRINQLLRPSVNFFQGLKELKNKVY